jgi:hypothetical protein
VTSERRPAGRLPFDRPNQSKAAVQARHERYTHEEAFHGIPACAARNGSATNTFATFQAGCGEAHEFFHVRVVEPLFRGAAGWIACAWRRGELAALVHRQPMGTLLRHPRGAPPVSNAPGRSNVPARDGGDHREGDRPRPARLSTQRGRAGLRPPGHASLGPAATRLPEAAGARTTAYRRHGGLFDVSYAGRKVAAVATTSPHLLDGAASASMRLQRCRVAAGDLAGRLCQAARRVVRSYASVMGRSSRSRSPARQSLTAANRRRFPH